jgi:hypothetical protein
LEIDKIISDLKTERDRLAKAIAALIGMGTAGNGRRRGRKPGTKMKMAATGRKRRGGITKEGRKRLSELMKKRWAERKKKGMTKLAK